MHSIYIKASAANQQALRPLARALEEYLCGHTEPWKRPLRFTLHPARVVNEDRFAWRWSAEIGNTPMRMAWQGACDSWLRKRFTKPFSDTVPSVLIEVSVRQEREDPPVATLSEGLAVFEAVEPKHKMVNLIVPETLRRALDEVVSVIRNTKLIYEDWGFGEIDPHPRAVVNFYGPPGTGKTMAAHCIADALGRKIVIANFAEIESKYVGDSPKNLENIFKTAARENAVLFFDEADSFLGKRLTSISSSSDQAVNSLRSKLLQLLEDHDGVVVFCTNLLKNYDKAFDSRILRSLKFDLPDLSCRQRLLRRMIPVKLPFAERETLDESALKELAALTDGFSGREIKNGILQVLCSAAERGAQSFSVQDFRDGFRLMADERQAVRDARGIIDAKRKDKLSAQIATKLETGDFEIQQQKDKEDS